MHLEKLARDYKRAVDRHDQAGCPETFDAFIEAKRALLEYIQTGWEPPGSQPCQK